MRKNIERSPAGTKGKSARLVARETARGRGKGKEISDADLDKASGGVVGPCNHVRPS
jgi:hypothetical protein